jgi:hypothetical protein
VNGFNFTAPHLPIQMLYQFWDRTYVNGFNFTATEEK